MEGLDDSDDSGSYLEAIKQNSAEKGEGDLKIRHRYSHGFCFQEVMEQYSHGFCFQEECTVMEKTVKKRGNHKAV